MKTLSLILMIGGMTAVTFGARYPLMVLVGRVELPRRVFDALKFVPVAVLTAISVPIMLMPEGEGLALSIDNAHLLGGVVAGLVAWRTGKLLPTIVVGMGVFLLWRAVI